MDLEIRAVGETETGHSGASAVHIVDIDSIIIRQGQVLALYNYPELEIVQQTFVPTLYRSNPATVFEMKYYELFNNRMVSVDLRSMELQETVLNFTLSAHSTFLQYNDNIVVNDQGNVFNFNVRTHQCQDIVQLPPQFTNIIQMGKKMLVFSSQDQYMVFNTDSRQGVKFNKDNFSYPDCYQVKMSEDIVLCFGLQNLERDYRRSSIGVLWPYMRKQEAFYVIHRGEGTVHEARPAFCDDICLVADSSGRLLVLQSDTFRLVTLNMVPLELPQDVAGNPDRGHRKPHSETMPPSTTRTTRVCGPTFQDKVNFYSGR